MRRRTGRSLFRNRIVLLLLLGAIFFSSTWFYYFYFAPVNSQLQSQSSNKLVTPQQNIEDKILVMATNNKESKAEIILQQVGEELSSNEHVKEEKVEVETDLSYKVVTFYYP